MPEDLHPLLSDALRYADDRISLCDQRPLDRIGHRTTVMVSELPRGRPGLAIEDHSDSFASH
jgi:hypothetical protein